MGVSRNIALEVHTQIETSYNLISELLIGLWFENVDFNVRTFYIDTSDNDDLSDYMKFGEIELILNGRDLVRKRNAITVNIDKLNEGLIIKSRILENKFNDDNKFELYFSPGGGHNLEQFERNTDFSFYLNIILPKLNEIGCHTTQITCLDFG